jgi:hypothetical protein
MAASEQIVCWKYKFSAGVNCLLKIGKINCLLGHFCNCLLEIQQI